LDAGADLLGGGVAAGAGRGAGGAGQGGQVGALGLVQLQRPGRGVEVEVIRRADLMDITRGR
jgi:hypothetical protein